MIVQMNQEWHKRPLSAGGFAKKFAVGKRPGSAGAVRTVQQHYHDLGNDRISRDRSSRDIPTDRVRSISAHSRKRNICSPLRTDHYINDSGRYTDNCIQRGGRTPRALRDRIVQARRRNSDSKLTVPTADPSQAEHFSPNQGTDDLIARELSNTPEDGKLVKRLTRPVSASATTRGRNRKPKPAWNQTYGPIKNHDHCDYAAHRGVYDEKKLIYRAHATGSRKTDGHVVRPTSPLPGVALQQKLRHVEGSIQKKHNRHGSPCSRSPSPPHTGGRRQVMMISGRSGNLEEVFDMCENEVKDEVSESGESWGDLISPSVLHIQQKFVMPCLKSDEVIFSECVSRLRKTAMVRDALERNIEESRQKSEIKELNRQARLVQAREQAVLQDKQRFWMVIVLLAQSGIKLKSAVPRLNAKSFLEKKKHSVVLRKASIDLLHSFDFEDRLISGPEDVLSMDTLEVRFDEFIDLLERQLWRFQIAINILQKRVAVRIIKTFFKEVHTLPKIKSSAGVFLNKVKIVQRAARKVIYCRRTRIELLLKVWNKLEPGYIKFKLKSRLDEKSRLNLENLDTSFPTVAEPLRKTFSDQHIKWKKADEKMRVLLQKIENDTNIAIESPLHDVNQYVVSDAEVQKMQVSYAVKEAYMFELYKEKRKDYIQLQDRKKKITIATQASYSIDDAKAYIVHGVHNAIPSAYYRVFDTFNVQRLVTNADIKSCIAAAHESVGTFTTKKPHTNHSTTTRPALTRQGTLKRQGTLRSGSVSRQSSGVGMGAGSATGPIVDVAVPLRRRKYQSP